MHLNGAHRARYVTACQQFLALGTVLAVLTPAATIVSLEMVQQPALDRTEPAGPADLVASKVRAEEVPATPVAPDVRTVPLGQETAARGGGATRAVQSSPTRVAGDGTVGITWSLATPIEESTSSFEVRTEADGSWSAWTEMPFHSDHLPDPESVDAEQGRAGTDAVYVGDVDRVQARVTVEGDVPRDLSLTVVDPGTTSVTAREAPALDPAAPARAATTTVTARPRIFTRAQWGADESMRRGSRPSYYEVHGGFVHHTVTTNSYTRAQVPGIIRGIYAYHTRSLGWSDIGYNYLVDRFGRIWEGRFGGIDRPVVGAHTLGYNSYSFAMSALGNYETARPSQAMLDSYARLFAWKLSLHGVRADSRNQVIAGRAFPAINGHRDAGSTACPGRNLYAQLPSIRRAAAALQADWSGRQRSTALSRGTGADLVVRRESDGRGMIIPIRNGRLQTPIDTGVSFARANRIFNVGDWDRDGHNDVVMRARNGNLLLFRGDGTGKLAGPTRIATGFGGVTMLAAVGDMTGDGYPDLMGQPQGGPMMIYPGAGANGLDTPYAAHSRIRGNRHVGVGLMDGDGAPDSLVRVNRRLVLYPGNGPGGLKAPARTFKRGMATYDWVTGVGDVTGNGRPDLVVRSRKTGEVFRIGTINLGLQKRVSLGTADGYDLVG